MDESQQPDVMTATNGEKTYVVSQSMQDALNRHSEEMAVLIKWLKAVAIIAIVALLGVAAIYLVKFDVAIAFMARLLS